MINEGATAFRDLLKRLGPMGLAFISWTVIVVAALTGAPEFSKGSGRSSLGGGGLQLVPEAYGPSQWALPLA